jgi:hypothetical protein
MRGSAFIAFFGLAIAISGSLVGCGDDDGDDDDKGDAPAKVVKSGEGESCIRTDDCADGLACFGNVCQDAPNGTGGTGTGGSSTGGRGGTGTTTLGGEGESCTRRADCAQNLSCFNQRCTSGTGEGGGGNTPTRGTRGETCVVSSDCETPFLCLPGGTGTSGPYGFTGVCSDADTEIDPTGNVCGAECREAVDCCQIPVELHATIGVKTCADLADVLDGVTCNSSATAQNQARCLVDQAFCDGCGEDTWECTAGRCIYNAECTADGLVPSGCPTFSRAGFALNATCDVGESDRCQPAAVDPLCEADADCDTLAVSDDLGDTCNAGECTCFQAMCLRRCDSDLDCRVGFICDDGDDVCVPDDACTSHLTCQSLMGDIRAACMDGACTMPCEVDLDCNPTGLVEGEFTRLCNENNQCEDIGCTQDLDCGGTVNGVKLFCTTPEAAAGARAAQSAITD